MRTIWRFEIQPSRFNVILPSGSGAAKVILVAMRHNDPFVWVEFDENVDLRKDFPSQDLQRLTFEAIPTGDRIPDKAIHVGSWLMHNDSLVWHLYQIL